MSNNWSRICSFCGREQIYKLKNNYDKHINDLRCSYCKNKGKKWSRICPSCKKEIFYTSKSIRDLCINKLCRSCSASEINKRPGLRDSFIKRYATKGQNCGEQNGFYGKHHTDENKKLAIIRNKKNSNIYKTQEFRDKISKITKGKKPPTTNTTYYEFWKNKYGEEEAKKRDIIRKNKLSKANSGKNNPMYGKPTPQGAGNGWSGWYAGCFFRSLKELSYIVNVLEKEGHKWCSADSAKIRIKYTDWNGNDRTYVPDFFVDENLLIEIKPSKLNASITVSLKKEAAEKYCEKMGWVYSLIDQPKLSLNDIKQLYDNGKIKFTNKYHQLYQKFIENH